eukprot:gene8406-18912_t
MQARELSCCRIDIADGGGGDDANGRGTGNVSEGAAGGVEFHRRGMVFTLHDGPHGPPFGGLLNRDGMDGIGWYAGLVNEAKKD